MSFGNISQSEFDEALEKFVSYSSKLLDDWKLVRDKRSGVLFGSKSLKKIISNKNCFKEVLNVEYHIVYSVSYRVPVIYVRMFDESGRIVTDVEKMFESICAPSHVDHLKSIKWESLTQQPHPILQTPFFQLHPCHTDTWMTLILKDLSLKPENVSLKPENYLVTWLSFVGPNVGIYLDNEYAKLIEQKQL